MQTPLVIATLSLLICPAFCVAQQPATAPPAAPSTSAQAAAPVTASTLLQPALNSVVTVLNGLKIDKWKKGSVREEAGQNVASILRDVQNNVPPLMGAADAAPGSLSAAMPLVKHLDALYDVLLRVEEASRVAAPGEQISQLQDALTVFGAARFALDDEMQKQAAAQEKQVVDLRAALAKSDEAVRAAQAKADEKKPCAAPASAAHHRRHRTIRKKSAAPAPAQKPTPSKPQ